MACSSVVLTTHLLVFKQLTFATIIPCVRTSTSYISLGGVFLFVFVLGWVVCGVFGFFFGGVVFSFLGGFLFVFIVLFFKPVCSGLQMCLSLLTIWKLFFL